MEPDQPQPQPQPQPNPVQVPSPIAAGPISPSKRPASIVAIVAMVIIAIGVAVVGVLVLTSRPTALDPAVAPSVITADTNCYSFTGIPKHYISNGQSAAAECLYEVELRGETGQDGQPVVGTAGSILGTIRVEPIRSTTSAAWGKDLDQIMTYLNAKYFPPQGEIIVPKEPVTLDGVRAYKTVLKSNKSQTKTKSFITVVKEPGYTLKSGATTTVFVVSIVTPEKNGEQILSDIIKSWKWK